jgi:hypothetical protein
MTQHGDSHRIRLTREVPVFRGKMPIGTEMAITTVNAFCISSPCKTWEVHGLSSDAFEFIHDGNVNEVTPATLPAVAEPDEIELPSFV